jgi:hypothetical protein
VSARVFPEMISVWFNRTRKQTVLTNVGRHHTICWGPK